MKVDGKDYRTVWAEGSSLYMIDQNVLPFEFKIVKSKNYHQTCEAIKDMTVRGAGAIGATAGFALAQAIHEQLSSKLNSDFVVDAKQEIENTRPTAQNLFTATKRVYAAYQNSPQSGIEEALRIADEDAAACKKIGEYGSKLIEDGFNVETHCNAGWLAFVDYGSALAPIYVAHRNGMNVHVYVDETRPRGQGARLTAWELMQEGVPNTVIADNAGAHLMSQKKVDLMIVGADRIAANGDTANKIGTLEKAIAAKYYGVLFYVAAPTSTFDLKCRNRFEIIIEERSEEEVLYQMGRTAKGKVEKVLVCAPGSTGFNPAFDVTPAELIRGIITEKGIVKPNKREIMKLFR